MVNPDATYPGLPTRVCCGVYSNSNTPTKFVKKALFPSFNILQLLLLNAKDKRRVMPLVFGGWMGYNSKK
jgi:hypothetical protein